MKYVNFRLRKVVYFEDETGKNYRAFCETDVELRHADTWEKVLEITDELYEKLKIIFQNEI